MFAQVLFDRQLMLYIIYMPLSTLVLRSGFLGALIQCVAHQQVVMIAFRSVASCVSRDRVSSKTATDTAIDLDFNDDLETSYSLDISTTEHTHPG